MSEDFEDPRRDFLVRALGLGLFAMTPAGILLPPGALAAVPSQLPPGKSIYRIEGQVWVDGVSANIDTRINANSLVKTGPDSQIIFVVGTDAFLLRANSEMQLGGSGLLISLMRVITGGILSVFGRRAEPHRVQTLTATIGIRGTGIYVETDPEKSYVCTCYGRTEIASLENPDVYEEVRSRHHDRPLYVMAGRGEKAIQKAPFINHTDAELALIEALVGRSPPFAFTTDSYRAPRRRSY